jgi:hypothetical protein
MSRAILAIATAAVLCASTEIASADQAGAFTGMIGGAAIGAAAGGPVGAVVGGIGGAALGNAMTGPRYYHHRYAYYHRHPHHFYRYEYGQPYSP